MRLGEQVPDYKASTYFTCVWSNIRYRYTYVRLDIVRYNISMYRYLLNEECRGATCWGVGAASPRRGQESGHRSHSVGGGACSVGGAGRGVARRGRVRLGAPVMRAARSRTHQPAAAHSAPQCPSAELAARRECPTVPCLVQCRRRQLASVVQ